MSKFIHCTIITPERQVVATDAAGVILPSHDGLVGVLPGHAAFLCQLGMGLLRLRGSGDIEDTFFIDGGFCHVLDDELTVLTGHAIGSQHVSRSQAEAAVSEAAAMPAATLEEVAARSKAAARAKYLLVLSSSS